MATDIVELSVDGAKEYQGDYELYLYQKQQESQKVKSADQSVLKKINNNKKEEIAAPKKAHASCGS